tara:strand:+ start:137488 stop:138903 length:1416 start_codon:yes stop_codon:yes gene_type:complete
MLTTAYYEDGTKVHISDYAKGEKKVMCAAKHPLVGKKGKIVVHHFAHAKNTACDPWNSGTMTHWHAQWQNIVADQINHVEIFIGQDGNCLKTGEPIIHIADIIRPSSSEGIRPLIVEIQHSPMSLETMRAREAYYQAMVWVFDFTPRLVKKGNHNRISLIDGVMHYLMDKVTYMAVMTCSVGNTIGTFVIVHSRTKYWFDSEKPTFYDTGFCMLELLHRLEKGFVFTRMITYKQFISANMPPVDEKKVEAAKWFNDDFSLMEMIKLGLLPNVIDVSSIVSGVDRLEILYPGEELGLMGFILRPNKEYPNGVWCAGSYHTAMETPQPINEMNLNVKAVVDIGLRTMMNDAIGNVRVGSTGSNNNNMDSTTYSALLIERLKRFLQLKGGMVSEVVKKGKKTNVIVYCTLDTFKAKDKFKMLDMAYRNPIKYKKSKKYSSNDTPDPNAKHTVLTHPYYFSELVDLDNHLRILNN